MVKSLWLSKRVTYLVKKVDDLVQKIGALTILELLLIEDLGLAHKVTFVQIGKSVAILRHFIKVVSATFRHFGLNHSCRISLLVCYSYFNYMILTQTRL